MFYQPDKRDHGLPRAPFKALVVPRPIGWISSVDPQGRPNLAPYSYFNGVSSDPPCVMFAPSMRSREGMRKDSHSNAELSGDFVVNLATYELREAMNASSASLAAGENEFTAAGLETLPSRLIKPPRVKGAPVHLECVYLKTVDLPSTVAGQANFIVGSSTAASTSRAPGRSPGSAIWIIASSMNCSRWSGRAEPAATCSST